MKRVLILSILLFVGLLSSQLTPTLIGDYYEGIMHVVHFATMLALAFVMIHVGYDFEIDKTKVRSYVDDYLIAATTAGLPWLFVAFYFIFVINYSPDTPFASWKESFLLARFAAPTSAGVLFSMLAVAGLGSTWLFRKARVLAVFDDLDTVAFMIPLKILIVGIHWQLFVSIFVMLFLLFLAWKFLHAISLKMDWYWVILYSIIITVFCEAVFHFSMQYKDEVPIQIEVLLPAFVLGVMVKKYNMQEGLESIDILHSLKERKVAYLISAVFMILVGLSMPSLLSKIEAETTPSVQTEYISTNREFVGDKDLFSTIEDAYPLVMEANIRSDLSKKPSMSWYLILYHVFIVTIISNIGKLFPLFCYSKEANIRQRLALSIAMFPRGEVGAGVILISLSYGVGGDMLTISILSLALNLILTGFFIYFVKHLIKY